MTTKLKSRGFLILAMLTLFSFSAGKAYAVNPIAGTSVISPYFQMNSSDDYSFVAVSHPSLSNMASQVGVFVEALDRSDASVLGSVSFTVDAGQTARVFIFSTGNTISAAGIPLTRNSTVAGAGSLRFTPVATSPTATSSSGGVSDGKRDITQLSFWGVIVLNQSGQTNGFAMEFIGDLHDSTSGLD